MRTASGLLLVMAVCLVGLATTNTARADCGQIYPTQEMWVDKSFISGGHVFINKVWFTFENPSDTDCVEPLAYFTLWDTHENFGETLWTTPFLLVVPAFTKREIMMEINYDSRNYGDSYGAKYPKLSISAGRPYWEMGYPQQAPDRQ
jgi:hypothetical protein